MAGPHGGNSQGPSFHDPLLIRTGLATKSRVHSHKNMILQRGNLAGLEGVCGGKFLYGFSFFFLQFFFISLRCKIFCDSGFLCFFFVFCFYIKHLRSRTQTQYKQWPPTPPLGPPLGWGLWGPPLALLWLFSWRLAPVGRCGVLGQMEFVQQFRGEMVTERIPERDND